MKESIFSALKDNKLSRNSLLEFIRVNRLRSQSSEDTQKFNNHIVIIGTGVDTCDGEEVPFGVLEIRWLDYQDPDQPIKAVLEDNSSYWLYSDDYNKSFFAVDKAIYNQIVNSSTESKTTTNSGKIEMKAENIISTVVTNNKDAVSLAAKIAVGQAGNNIALKAVKPVLPVMIRGYAETEIGKIVIANVAAVAVQQFAPSNTKAVAVTKAMVDASMMELVSKIDIDGLIDQLTSKIDAGQLANLMKTAE